MSLQKMRHSLIKFLVTQLRGPRMYAGRRLDSENTVTVISGEELLTCIIVDVRSGVGVNTKTTSLRRFVSALREIDVRNLLVVLDRADAWLLASVEDRSLRNSAALKAATAIEPELREFIDCLNALLIPITRRWYREGDTGAFAYLHQVFAFLSHINLKIDELKKVALDGWYETERRNSWPDDVTGDEKNILSEWFPPADWERVKTAFCPGHGPGAVAQGSLTRDEKRMCVVLSKQEQDMLRTYGLLELLQGAGKMARAVFDMTPTEVIDYCLTTFVPKSWKSFRTISEESVERQWLQQGFGNCINFALMHHISKMWPHYAIDTEYLNRDLAWEGSIDGSYATLDLSSASDSVPWNLVCDWFANTWQIGFIIGTRATYADVDKPDFSGRQRVEQKKYAPMGSRLCFPIMTEVLCSICESSVRKSTGSCAMKDDFVVYGDDIVIRTDYAASVIERLTELGFTVNMRKSFYNTSEESGSADFFRESCGGEYLNGADVTAIRIPRRFRGFLSKHKAEKSPTHMGGLIELANNLVRLPTARLRIVEYILDQKIPVLFDETGDRGVFTPNPTNLHIPSGIRWNEDLQRYEVYAWCLCPHRVADEASMWTDEIRLFEYLMASDGRRSLTWPEDRITIPVDPFADPRAELHWVALGERATQYLRAAIA